MIMSSSISTPTFLCSTTSKLSIYSLSSPVSYPKSSRFQAPTWVLQLGFSPFSPWSGLKHLGISVSTKSLASGDGGKKSRCRGKVVHASLFGVGAPEALVIGVVALLVFGPKGLAEVARNLGKTLRAFQPTIRELQDVSREFKSTLEREIGLDEISGSTQNMYGSNRTSTVSTPPSVVSNDNSQTMVDPNGTSPPNKAYTSEEYLKITEEQLKASATQQQVQSPSPPPGESLSSTQATSTETSSAVPPPRKPEI